MPPVGQRTGPPTKFEIVVPARNEARRLPDGLAALCRKAATLPLPTAILVVDSASTDLTGDIVAGWPAGPVPVRLLRCRRAGKGLAVRVGLLATRAPFVGFCDADMATDLSALDVAVSLLTAGNPVVIGSRALAASAVEDRHSGTRRAGAAAFRVLARQVVPGATDTQCGFKFFAGPLARDAALSLRTAGFAFDVELIARCQRLGAPVTEIPVCWRDVPGSTFSVPRHTAGTLRDVAAIWLRMRAGAPIAARTPASRPPLPAGLQVLPPALQALPAGAPALPPGVSAFPAGAPAFPAGVSAFPAGVSAFPPGATVA
jgi:dolichyl-phosphate beta-glucosyltransferase